MLTFASKPEKFEVTESPFQTNLKRHNQLLKGDKIK